MKSSLWAASLTFVSWIRNFVYYKVSSLRRLLSLKRALPNVRLSTSSSSSLSTLSEFASSLLLKSSSVSFEL